MKKEKIKPIEDENYIIEDLSISSLVPNNIDNFIVLIQDDRHVLILPNTYTGLQFSNWRKGRGGIFSKDVLNHTLMKESKVGRYILVKGEGKNFIARLISEEEKDKFSILKLIDGQIKDVSYMILKNLDVEDKKHGIIEEEIEAEFFPSINKTIVDDEPEFKGGSVSLV